MATELTERDLMIRARGGDREAFGTLVTAHMRQAYRHALGLVGSHDDALDLSQEAFARVFRRHESLDPERPFYGLVYQVLRRLGFNWIRDRRSRAKKLETYGGWLVERQRPPDPARVAEVADLRDRIEAAIDALADREREVLVLKEFEGLKYREIAELLGIPNGTVMSRLYAARRSLAEKLEEIR